MPSAVPEKQKNNWKNKKNNNTTTHKFIITFLFLGPPRVFASERSYLMVLPSLALAAFYAAYTAALLALMRTPPRFPRVKSSWTVL